ncbi:MAG TPA: protein kinase [Ktedonobacteraceae bacterium]
MEGQTAGIDVRRYLRSQGIFDEDSALIIILDVAIELGTLHSHGIIHGNVRPQNIWIRRNDRRGEIIPPGKGHYLPPERAQDYYAPEQVQGKIITPATDVYSLGLVMYEMLTCQLPFDGHKMHTPIPQHIESLIMRCRQVNPELRYHNGVELAHALEVIPH